MTSEIITINMAEMAVGSHDTVIRTMSLGSCIAIILYDNKAKVGGMAHVMLPMRKVASANFVEETQRNNISGSGSVAKFADEAVERLLHEIEKMGAKREDIRAKLVGGAKMFRLLGGDDKGIGFRNAESARSQLSIYGIQIESEDVGGTAGRSVDFNIGNGLAQIITVI